MCIYHVAFLHPKLDYCHQLWEYYRVTDSIQKHTAAGVSALFNLFPLYTNLSIPAHSHQHMCSSRKHSHTWVFSKPFLLPQVNAGSQKVIDDTHFGGLEYFFEWHSGFNLDHYFCMVIWTSPELTSAHCVMGRDHWVLMGSFMIKSQGQFQLNIIVFCHFWRKGAFRQWTKYSGIWQVPLWYACWLVFKSPVQKKNRKTSNWTGPQLIWTRWGPSPLVSGPVSSPWFLSEIKDWLQPVSQWVVVTTMTSHPSLITPTHVYSQSRPHPNSPWPNLNPFVKLACTTNLAQRQTK